MTSDQAKGNLAAGVIIRSREEIARVLEVLVARAEPLQSILSGADVIFDTKLLHVDSQHRYLLMAPSTDEAANEALLARAYASFRAIRAGIHVEFSCGDPRRLEHDRGSSIQLRFPDVMATRRGREHERQSVEPPVSLRFLADAGGVISFEGSLVDISSGGIGFVQYAPNITLEPGTLLTGCRIDLPGRPPVTVDLEVRYSSPTTLPDGREVLRSGCRFVDPAPELKALLAAFFRGPTEPP